MIATDILSDEHRVILKVLDCLERIAAEGLQEGRVNEDAARSALEFIREFVDGAHHAKEEDRLFVAMERHGFRRDSGPIAVMLAEHEEGRACVRSMSREIERAVTEERAAAEGFAAAAQTFVLVLRAHIDREDSVLFPMAGQVLGSEEGESLLSDFRAIEEEAGGERHRTYFGLARRLCERYDVPFNGDSETPTLVRELLSSPPAL